MATCVVTISLELAGAARVGSVVLGRQVPPNANIAQDKLISTAWQNATTDSNGDATITFEQGTRARIVCDDAGIDVEFDVPQQATYNLAEEKLT
jgi:hypothetical protein